jgi:hypothetical protein
LTLFNSDYYLRFEIRGLYEGIENIDWKPSNKNTLKYVEFGLIKV